jgi:phosphomevalonate kinase
VTEWLGWVFYNAAEHDRVWGTIAEAGCVAAREDDGEGFLAAMLEYGRCLDALGKALGVDIVTAQHREIGDVARHHGVVYKVSGAGGGDLGLAACADPEALEAFKQSVAGKHYQVVDLSLDRRGLVVEERTE